MFILIRETPSFRDWSL